MQKEQQGGVHVMKQVSGLMALRAQRKADLSGPADERINTVRYLENWWFEYQTCSFKNK